MLLALVWLTGCQCQQPPTLISADGELRADALRVGFGDVWLRSTGRRPLGLANTGRAPITVSLAAAPPFGAPAQLTLGAGESRQVELTFTPTALGPASGMINVRSGAARLTLALDGNGIATPPCDSTVCRAAQLDEATLTCFQSPLPDGQPCSDRCVTGACSGGRCVGSLDPCDDGNRCTVDACSPGEGCVHLPAACAPTDPCSVGSCSPDAGCSQTQAADGAPCGAADCTTALICIAGQCVTRSVPEGVPCGPESVCQPRGTCVAQACVQAAPKPLTQAWIYKSPERLHGLVADPQGNYFTAECRYAGTFKSQCELISFAPGGTERWRKPFPHISQTGMGALRDSLMVAGEVLISTIGPDWVDAFDLSTGAHKWSVNTASAGLFGTTNPSWVRIISTAFNGIDELILTLESNTGGSIGATRLIGLVSTTGVVRHNLALPAQGFSLAVDRNAGIYLAHLSGYPSLNDTVTALDPKWNVRWQRATPVLNNRITFLRATHYGRLFLTHPMLSQLWSTAGVSLSSTLPTSVVEPLVAWSDTALFATEQFCPNGVTCQSFYDYRLALVAIDNQSLAVSRVVLPNLSWYTGPWLTQRGTVLVSLLPRTSPAELEEYDGLARLRMKCPLGLASNRKVHGGPLLSTGQYAMISGIDDGYQMQLEVWELPGYSPSPKGWVSPRGGPGLDSRAR